MHHEDQLAHILDVMIRSNGLAVLQRFAFTTMILLRAMDGIREGGRGRVA